MTQIVPLEERPPPSSFAGVIQAATAGEGWAVDSLAAQCLPRLTSFAEARGAIDPGGVADLVLIELLHRLGSLQFDTPAQLWSYIYRIARSRIADERRSAKPVELVEHVAIERLAAPAPGFDQQVADRHWVHGLLSELTSEQREVLEMRFLDDLSIEETASRTGRTLSAVKGLQRRAIRALSAAALLAAVALAGWLFWWLLHGGPPSTVVPGPADQPSTTQPPVAEAGLPSGDGLRAVSDGGPIPAAVTITNLAPDPDDQRSAVATFEPAEGLVAEGFNCRLDGEAWSRCTSPVVYRNLADGNHVIEIQPVDASGSAQAPAVPVVWKVAVTQPPGTPAGVDLAALRAAGAVLECNGKTGTLDQLEAAGFDVMVGTEGDDVIDVSGGDRPDLVIAYDGNDTIRTGPGDDQICAGGGNDSIESGAGKDRIAAGGGNDSIAAGADDDTVYAGGGNDTVSGGPGNDTLRGESGLDLLQGDDGNDQLSGDNDLDVVVGGAGTDSCGPPDPGLTADPSCETAVAPTTTTRAAPTTAPSSTAKGSTTAGATTTRAAAAPSTSTPTRTA
ncbi:MAG: sigma-70 family RNA polymerase sigma factor [Acidimicrobiales bacterium]